MMLIERRKERIDRIVGDLVAVNTDIRRRGGEEKEEAGKN